MSFFLGRASTASMGAAIIFCIHLFFQKSATCQEKSNTAPLLAEKRLLLLDEEIVIPGHPVHDWLRSDQSFFEPSTKPILGHKAVYFIPKKKLDPIVQNSLPVFVLKKLEDQESTGVKERTKAWLGLSHIEGATNLWISMSPSVGSEGAKELEQFHLLSEHIQSLPPPLGLEKLPMKPDFNLSKANTSQKRGTNSWGSVIFEVTRVESQDPMLREACDFMGKWLETRQLVFGKAKPQTVKGVTCSLSWADRNEAIKNNPLVKRILVGKFPLPIWSEEEKTYPIRTHLDARSVTVLQNLKGAKELVDTE